MKTFRRYTVTAALPYVNGPIHIGHLAGVYIPADIYVRWLRLKGEDVLFIGGSDEHGVPITLRAEQEGVHPKVITDRYHFLIKESFEKIGISFDIYSRTSLQIHHQTAQKFFLTLLNKNYIEVKEVEQFYDEESQKFLADRYIIGTCPHCSYDRAYGDQCEQCGSSLSPTDLIHPTSILSGKKPVLRKTKHWFLKLNDFQSWLEHWILNEHSDWKANVLGQCRSWLQQGLHSRAVTRDLQWGVPLPLDDASEKVLYVWFDAPIGYISAAIDWSIQTGKDWKPYWLDKETRLIHFIGKDNIVFHCIIFPSMLKGEGSYILPDNVPANEFLNLEGRKISTSRNWAVWLHEYLEDFSGKEDVLRYVLCSIMPENKDSDFTWIDFQAKNNNELVSIYGNFVHRVLILINKYFNSYLPESRMDENNINLITQANNFIKKIDNSINEFKFREALGYLMDIARLGNKFLTESEPWKKVNDHPDQAANVIFTCVQLIAKLSIVGEPFLPFTSKKLRQMLNIDVLSWDDSYKTQILPAGHLCGNPKMLFEKIDEKIVEKQIIKLKQNETILQLKQTSQKPLISQEDFSKLDLRICKIIAAEKIPKTKKLLKITVDTGIDKREIVSGIAHIYEPEEIIGKQVLAIINLKPIKIKGILSHGMILLAEDSQQGFIFVKPEIEIENGSMVK